MTQPDPFNEKKLKQTQLYIYLLPVFGLIPSLWTLSQGQGDAQQKSISRLSVTLTVGWLLIYTLLWASANDTSELLSFRLAYINALVSSGYFLACFALMFRLWLRKKPGLSGLNKTTNILDQKNPSSRR